MTKDVSIILLGLLVTLLPFLGFPSSWERVMYVASGCGIIVLMLLFRRDIVTSLSRKRRTSHRPRSAPEGRDAASHTAAIPSTDAHHDEQKT